MDTRIDQSSKFQVSINFKVLQFKGLPQFRNESCSFQDKPQMQNSLHS